MPHGQFDTVVRYLRRVAGDPGPLAITDAQLLERFRRSRDEEAFCPARRPPRPACAIGLSKRSQARSGH